jgi:large subunit ribosomal protein L5
MMPRLREKYLKEVVPNMIKEFSYGNIIGSQDAENRPQRRTRKAIQNVKLIDAVQKELSSITGQEISHNKAKKSIAAFKLRKADRRSHLRGHDV